MKFIVYCTTCKINGKIYIGVHKTENPNVFDGYIGNGLKIGYNIKNPKTAFQHAVKKYGYSNFVRNTLFVFDNEEEAYLKEKEIVTLEFIRQKDNYNTNVGNKLDVTNYRTSKHSEIYQYDENGNLLNIFKSNKEASEKLNITLTSLTYARSHKTLLKGFYFLSADDNVDNIIKIKEEIYKITDKSVSKYKNGILIYTYPNMKQAAKENNISVSEIKKSIKLEDGVWSYGYSKIYKSNKNPIPVKVNQYDLNGNLIKTWDSISQCRKEFPKLKEVLLKNRNHTHGFTFKYVLS